MSEDTTFCLNDYFRPLYITYTVMPTAHLDDFRAGLAEHRSRKSTPTKHWEMYLHKYIYMYTYHAYAYIYIVNIDELIALA